MSQIPKYIDDLVSIITPAHNSSRFIEDCINSVLNQTYYNWEMCIVDDASKDNTVDLIRKYENNDKRIKLIVSEKRLGAAEARNVAIRASKGRFIAFLDSDDVWTENKLERQLNWMRTKDYAFTFTSYYQMSESGLVKNNSVLVPSRISYNGYLSNTIIGCLTVLIDRTKAGYFEMPLIRSSHDMALWLLIIKKVKYAYGLNEKLAKYRLVETSNTANKFKAAKDVWKVYRNFEKLSMFRSIWHFMGYVLNAVLKRI